MIERQPTYYDQPILKQPVWIWAVPAYFYIGGVSGAALVLGTVAQMRGDPAFRSLVRACRWIGFLGQGLGSVLLIIDLGRPSRFLNMLRVFRPTSPLNLGSWVLAAGGSLAGVSAMLPDRVRFIRKIGDSAGLGAGVLGIPLSGYTGVVLCTSAIPVWRDARHTLPALFVASAIASSASLFELLPMGPRERAVVHRFGLIGKTAELAGMVAVERELDSRGDAASSLRSGLPGALWTASKILTATSLVAAVLPGRAKSPRAAGILGTLGALSLRFAVFYAGSTSARHSS